MSAASSAGLSDNSMSRTFPVIVLLFLSLCLDSVKCRLTYLILLFYDTRVTALPGFSMLCFDPRCQKF